MAAKLDCFKAYDVRGRLPDQLNEELVYRIGRAYAQYVRPARVVVGYDVRPSSIALSEALIAGLMAQGCEVHELGLCGTEEVYFATWHYALDGGIMITASHNPADYNGLKFVREQARPLSADAGLPEIEQLAQADVFTAAAQLGTRRPLVHRQDYVAHLLGYVDRAALKPLKVVVNPGNGCAGPTIDALAEHLPLQFMRINFTPDGTFPHGIPNPLLPENRAATAEAVLAHEADFGIAWDGDFDRCFLFDERGRFIEGYYIVGLLAEAFCKKQPGAKIVYDPRLVWNTEAIIRANGGIGILSKAGHAFIKARMRAEDAVYGGEMSAHHYFKDFGYCDSGMIPWLLVAELICRSGRTLGELVDAAMQRYPSSGEINRSVADPAAALAAIEAHYSPDARRVMHVDGLSVEYDDWRFNLRPSNTEPLLRLNVEARGDQALMQDKTQELLARLEPWSSGGHAG